MKKIFTKIGVSFLAVTTMAASMVCINTSAYGGTGYFYHEGVYTDTSIDGTKTVGGGSTTCNSNDCSYVWVKAQGFFSTGNVSNSYHITRGTASISVHPETGYQFQRVETKHTSTINNHTYNPPYEMVVYIS